MAGSHEVRGSIPLGSTTDTRGARRRRRAPLFLLPGTEKKARGARLLLGVAAGRLALARLPWSLLVSFGGVGAGRRPFLVRPDSPAPFERPGGKRVPAAHGHREAGALAPARPAREEAAPDLFGRIEAICSRAGTHSALGRLGPAEFEEADWPKGNGRPKAAQKPSTESGWIQVQRQRVREPRHRRPAGGARCPEAPLPQGTRATTRPSSPPTGPRRRGSPIGGRPPASAGSAASPTHASGGAAGRGRIRRGAAWAPRSSGMRDCPRGKRLAGRRESAAGSDAPSSLAISKAPSPSARRRLIYEMADMPTISLPAPLDRLPRRRPKRPIEGNGRRLCLCGERSAVKDEAFILRIPE